MTDSDPLPVIIDTINTLICIMEEESETIALPGARPDPQRDLAELALAKSRLAGRLEQLTNGLARENPYWMKQMDDVTRGQLTKAYTDLHTASVVNADVLERQIDLSTELLAAVGMEIERLTGHGSKTYGVKGDMRRAKGRPPLSINTRI